MKRFIYLLTIASLIYSCKKDNASAKVATVNICYVCEWKDSINKKQTIGYHICAHSVSEAKDSIYYYNNAKPPANRDSITCNIP